MLYTKKWGDNVKQYLYNKGDEFTAFTGGWTTSLYAWTGYLGSASLKPTLTKGTDNMRCYLLSTDVTRHGSVFPTNPITVDNFKKLCVQIKNDTASISNAPSYCCLTTANPASANYASPNIVYSPNTTGKGEYIATFDISSLTGNYYLSLSMVSLQNNANDLYIEKVWLE